VLKNKSSMRHADKDFSIVIVADMPDTASWSKRRFNFEAYPVLRGTQAMLAAS
jgi:hypothetical protein